MSSIRGTHTRPEMVLLRACRRALKGLRLVQHPPEIEGRPDIYIPSLRLALFCDGCFFHGCPVHCRIPRRNRTYWVLKIHRNTRRDQSQRRGLRRKGFHVWRFWEHACVAGHDAELQSRLAAIVRRLRPCVQARRARSPAR